MDDSSISLPPLNSHPFFSIIANATQILADPDMPSQSSFILWRLKLKVKFYSDTLLKGKHFAGQNVLVNIINIPRDMPRATSKAHVSNILRNEEYVQFQLSGTTYSETCSTDHDGSRIDKFLMSRDDLVNCFNDFLRKSTQDGIVRGVILKITKKVLMPDSEFNEWISYIEQQTSTHKEFKQAFEYAITQPRTQDQLIDEAMSYATNKSTSVSMDDELKDMAILDEDEESSCVVCLEEFCRESKLKRLSCSHVFHKECIVRWFDSNDMCPVCRCKLPVVVIVK